MQYLQATSSALLHNNYGLDAAHMKHRKYNGQLVLFTARDGNNKNLVLAAALVPTEDTEQYLWVLQQIKQGAGVADVLDQAKSVVISDRDKGIAAAVTAELPAAHQSKCFKHILGNLKTHLARKKAAQLGLYESLAWAACKAGSMAEYEANMRELAGINAGDWCQSGVMQLHLYCTSLQAAGPASGLWTPCGHCFNCTCL